MQSHSLLKGWIVFRSISLGYSLGVAFMCNRSDMLSVGNDLSDSDDPLYTAHTIHKFRVNILKCDYGHTPKRPLSRYSVYSVGVVSFIIRFF